MFSYRNLPIRKITALSYSVTTLKHMKIAIGNVSTSRIIDKTVAITSMHPPDCPSAVEDFHFKNIFNNIFKHTSFMNKVSLFI